MFHRERCELHASCTRFADRVHLLERERAAPRGRPWAVHRVARAKACLPNARLGAYALCSRHALFSSLAGSSNNSACTPNLSGGVYP